MSKVAVVTDSTINIPADLAKPYPLFVVPLQLIWGNETFRDSVDITPTEFYTRLKTDKVNPSTSQPSPAVFIELYSKLLNQGYDILSVHISSRLSGTLASAEQAKDHFPGANIELVDSLSTSMATGLPLLYTLRAAAQGATLKECKALVEQGLANSGVLFAVSTLEYLHRGGRIGGAAAFLGTALNLKPILEMREGRIEAIERVRTMSKASERLLNLFEERINGQSPVWISALHVDAANEARELLELACQRFNKEEIIEANISEVSPVVGSHTGPGTLGLAYMAGIK
jgi:DegV family protein with EDD domain